MPRDRPPTPQPVAPPRAHPDPIAVVTGQRLPALASPLIGRDRELAFLRDHLIAEGPRLLSVLGPPGVGKTRLALEVAHATADRFADGAVFVDLTPIRDPGLIIYAVGHALGVREGGALDLPVERVKDALRYREQLLVIDNFEQVVEGSPVVGELLGACPRLKILATSREPLRLRWEQQFPLGPLPLPDLDPLPTLNDLVHNPAMAMFMSRARAVLPDFALTEHNGRSVAEICVRLDGLPLAIELVVGRIRTVPLHAIVAQLNRQLDFLTEGPRDLPVRQRALRSAIGWSHELLHPGEQALFRRLAVFAGGAGPDAIRDVSGEDAGPTVDPNTLAVLVDRNLLLWTTLSDGSVRYRMLESIREYGWEQLEAAGELEEMRTRHARFFLKLAEAAESPLMGPNEAAWHERLEREHDNMRLALEWALSADVGGALRAVGALRRFWNVRGHWAEGRAWVERALAKEEAAHVSPGVRAAALYVGSVLASLVDDKDAATQRIEECLALRRAIGDMRGTAEALWHSGSLARYSRHVPHASALSRAATMYEESLAVARQSGDTMLEATILQSLAAVAREQGDLVHARAWLQEALALSPERREWRPTAVAVLGLGAMALDDGALVEAERLFTELLAGARRHGDRRYIAEGLEHLGYVADRRGDFQRADSFLTDSLAIYRELGDLSSSGAILRRMGQIALRAADVKRGAALILESLELNRTLGQPLGIVKSLQALGVVVAKQRPAEAAMLLAAAAQLRETAGGPHAPEQQVFDQTHVQIEETLRREQPRSWEAGETMPLDQVFVRARSIARSFSRPAGSSTSRKAGLLTPREEEVARLVTRGMSNREISRSLVVSERTVASHVEHILGKLGFGSRAQIAAWVVGQGLDAPGR